MMGRISLVPTDAVLLVVDVQEAFRAAIGDFSPMVSKISTTVRGAELLGLEIVVTEQYPRGLGSTVEEISLVLPAGATRLEKTSFGVLGEDSIAQHLKASGKRQAVVCGLETHVCISQSCHQLLDAGFDVFILEDAVASRFENDRVTALNRLRDAGVIVTTVEAILFEGMGDSKHPHFKEIQALVK